MTASTVKTGLMYSPLTSKVYWGKMNTKTGVSIGNTNKDITSDFIGIMLQKFPINTSQNITSNGELECVVMVLDERKSHKYMTAPEMYETLDEVDTMLDCLVGESAYPAAQHEKIKAILAKARGEQ